MAFRPLVSVLMPFHNAGATIASAVESIRGQTLEEWELVAADDGSTDDARGKVAALAQGDSRIRLLPGRREGIVGALRRGMAACRAPLIARMDADDVAAPERLTRQKAAMDANPRLGLCGCQVRIVGEHVGPGRQRYAGWLNGLITHRDIERELFIECPIAHPAFCMRREACEQAGGYLEKEWPEDYCLVMRCWLAGWEMANVPEPLLDWRHTEGRLSMNDPRYGEGAFRALKRHYLGLSHLPKDRAFYQWGAGEVGKRWLREWAHRPPLAVVDINPRKIGKRIHGIPVIEPGQLPAPGKLLVLVAVGAPGARTEIRGWMAARGYEEIRDYLFIA